MASPYSLRCSPRGCGRYIANLNLYAMVPPSPSTIFSFRGAGPQYSTAIQPANPVVSEFWGI